MGQALSSTVLTGQLMDPKTGRFTHAAVILFLQWQQQLASGFDPSGNLKSNLLPTIGIVGRLGTIGAILQNIDKNGVVLSAGLTSATDTDQGAVILWAGAPDNTLGSAAGQPSTAFDSAGSAATAQTNAQTFATGAANTAQATAIATAATNANAAISAAFSAGLNVTIVTAALTPTGTQGSMTFTAGLLTAQVAAT